MHFGTVAISGLLGQIVAFLAAPVPSTAEEAAQQVLWFLPLAHRFKEQEFARWLADPGAATSYQSLALMSRVAPGIDRKIETLLRSLTRARRARTPALAALRLARSVYQSQQAVVNRALRIRPLAIGALAVDVAAQLESVAVSAPVQHRQIEGLAFMAAQAALA